MSKNGLSLHEKILGFHVMVKQCHSEPVCPQDKQIEGISKIQTRVFNEFVSRSEFLAMHFYL